MTREKIIKMLLEAAEHAAVSSGAEHPEDIAYAMMNAIEVCWVPIQSMRMEENNG